MYRMTEFYDSAGFMAKCAADIISLSQILLQHVQQSPVEKTWDTVSVGFLDPDKWKMDESMCEQFDGTAEQLVRKPTIVLRSDDMSLTGSTERRVRRRNLTN